MARTKEFDETEVLDKAMDLFWRKGYNGISAQELVDGLGLSRSSLYDTFVDKHTLFTRALEHYRAKGTNDIVNLLDNATSIPEAIKEVLIRAQKSSLQNKDARGCFMVNTRVELAPHDPEIAAIVKENWQALEDAYYRALKRGQDMGQITTTQNARALARFVVNNSWGLSVYGKSDADKKVIDDIIRVTLQTLTP
ncbi:TetR/AcrR family transcriptional regulator [Chryseolinea lacunae]|uniref:TetR/AcrR family transcriptional regulator n=1 Tax=Chryseolinea lacunae TaxID=2801331 RepID=A0ABS1KKQ0_9BACT|nr:TetR/AcrR family transcriptional regulator [Chryseolinea lacunae]MBL0740040.1 TetR/AcrR family transcriptional regulator [Chryseolinea lacunae]